jgi:hypothetical protein
MDIDLQSGKCARLRVLRVRGCNIFAVIILGSSWFALIELSCSRGLCFGLRCPICHESSLTLDKLSLVVGIATAV